MATLKRLQTPDFLSGDVSSFDYCFQKVFIVTVYFGWLAILYGRPKKSDSPAYRLCVRSGSPELPTADSQACLALHRVLQRMVEAGCFPLWVRQRLFFHEDPLWGPTCDKLADALRQTAMMTGEGTFQYDMFSERSFSLVNRKVPYEYVFEHFRISQKSAERWGKMFYHFWAEELEKEATWCQEQAAIKSATR